MRAGRILRVALPLAVVGAGIACIALGTAIANNASPPGLRSTASELQIQRSYAARASLGPQGELRITGVITVDPEPSDAKRSVVGIKLRNPHPDHARFHADIRAGRCERTSRGTDGRPEYQLAPIDNGVSSQTTLPVAASSLTTGGYIVVVLSIDDAKVFACATLLPLDPVLAAATQQVTSFERRCEGYLAALDDNEIEVLDPEQLPQGQCREQARDLVARTSQRALRSSSYSGDLAELTMIGLRDCLVDAGLDVPPLERTDDGVMVVLTGLAERNERWQAISTRCDRDHPAPEPMSPAS